MEQIVNKSQRPRRTQEQIELLLEEFENGKLKVSEFCELHKISNTTFHKWQSRYKRNSTNGGSSFAKLKISSPAIDHPDGLFAEVHGIKLFQPVTASYLKELASL